MTVLDNGGCLTCAVDGVSREAIRFAGHVRQAPPAPVSGLLLTAEPTTAA